MSKPIVAVGAVLFGTVVVAFYAQNRMTAALRRDIAALREELRASAVATQAEAMRAARTAPSVAVDGDSSSVVKALPAAAGDDLAKLREEIAALRRSTGAINEFVQTVQAAQALAKSSDSAATKLVPASQWKNAGRATPEASTETALWAAVGGDVDTLAGTLAFTESAKAKADAWFAALSDSTRQQYGSPEKVMALMIARDAAALSGMQVLGQKEMNADNVGLRVRIASNEGKTKDETFLMRRGTSGWQMVLNEGTLEKYARQLGGKK